MDAEDRLPRLAVFVGVALVIGLAALSVPDPAEPSFGYPDANDIVPEQVEASDETVEEGPVGDEPRAVLVDDTHGNRFDRGDLRPLRDALGPRHEIVFTTESQSDLRRTSRGSTPTW